MKDFVPEHFLEPCPYYGTPTKRIIGGQSRKEPADHVPLPKLVSELNKLPPIQANKHKHTLEGTLMPDFNLPPRRYGPPKNNAHLVHSNGAIPFLPKLPEYNVPPKNVNYAFPTEALRYAPKPPPPKEPLRNAKMNHLSQAVHFVPRPPQPRPLMRNVGVGFSHVPLYYAPKPPQRKASMGNAKMVHSDEVINYLPNPPKPKLTNHVPDLKQPNYISKSKAALEFDAFKRFPM